MDRMTRVAQSVEAARQAAGVSEIELARRTLIPRETLRRRLAGTSAFTIVELYAIAEALDLRLVTLLGEEAA